MGVGGRGVIRELIRLACLSSRCDRICSRHPARTGHLRQTHRENNY